MKKRNCYFNKNDYKKSYARLKAENELLYEHFFKLSSDYEDTIDSLSEDFPLLTDVCYDELIFHIQNIRKLKNLCKYNKKEDN